MFRRSTILLTACAASLALPAPAQARSSVAAQCGDVLTTDAHLAADLHCEGEGLTLDGAVTLDLRGHTLSGTSDAVAVALTPGGRAKVRGGTISGWGWGVRAHDDDFTAMQGDVERVTFVGNGTAVDVTNSDVTVSRSDFTDNYWGVNGWAGSELDIERSEFHGGDRAISVSTSGARLVDVVVADATTGLDCSEAVCTVSGSRFEDNDTAVYDFFGHVAVEDSLLRRNTTAVTGTFQSSLRIEGSQLSQNGTAVDVHGLSSYEIVQNVFKHNGSAITDAGFEEPTDSHVTLEANVIRNNGEGVVLGWTPSRLSDNEVFKNAGYGVLAPLAEDLGGNVAYKNGTGPQCTGVVCSAG